MGNSTDYKSRKYLTEIKILNKNLKGKILFEGLKWTGKKNFNELLSDGDIIFVKKNQMIYGL